MWNQPTARLIDAEGGGAHHPVEMEGKRAPHGGKRERPPPRLPRRTTTHDTHDTHSARALVETSAAAAADHVGARGPAVLRPRGGRGAASPRRRTRAFDLLAALSLSLRLLPLLLLLLKSCAFCACRVPAAEGESGKARRPDRNLRAGAALRARGVARTRGHAPGARALPVEGLRRALLHARRPPPPHPDQRPRDRAAVTASASLLRATSKLATSCAALLPLL